MKNIIVLSLLILISGCAKVAEETGSVKSSAYVVTVPTEKLVTCNYSDNGSIVTMTRTGNVSIIAIDYTSLTENVTVYIEPSFVSGPGTKQVNIKTKSWTAIINASSTKCATQNVSIHAFMYEPYERQLPKENQDNYIELTLSGSDTVIQKFWMCGFIND